MANKDQFKAEDFIRAIPGSAGIITSIAHRVDCTWHTAKKYCTEYPTVKRVYDAEKEGILDLAELELIKKVKGGDLGAIKYLLSTQGKERGYGDSMEHKGTVGFQVIDFNPPGE